MTVTIGRRELLAALGGAVVTWPLAARAQQPKVQTIGALVIGNISPEEFWREFRQGLRDLGYAPVVDASAQTAFVRDTVPQDIVTTPGVVATSVGSVYQTDETLLRLRWPITW